MNSVRHIHDQRGFALLEVLIAVVVLAVALLALGQFQTALLQSGADAKARGIATQLARELLDDLRSFEQLDTEAGKFAFSDITTDAGGNLGVAAHTLAGTAFTLSWAVTDYYYCNDLKAPVAGDATCGGTTPALPYPTFKQVAVTVTWVNPDEPGVNQTVVEEQAIYSNDPYLSINALALSLIDDGPLVGYTPGQAPDVIPITLDDGTVKETSVPEPEVSQSGEFVVTSFDEVYYNTTQQTLERVPFVTANCVCEQLGSGTGRTPLSVDTGGAIRIGEFVTKNTGTRATTGQLAQQSDLCEACCRDHHDTSATDADGNAYPLYDPWRPGSTWDGTGGNPNINDFTGGDHNHYYDANNDGVLELANSTGNLYYEACRFRRINGIPYVEQDWNLEQMQEIPANWLVVSANQTAWTNYVKDYVKAYIMALPTTDSQRAVYAQADRDNNDLPDTPTPDNSTPSGGVSWPGLPTQLDPANSYTMTANSTENMISRAIYMDYMTPELIADLQDKITNNEVFLPSTPFHEVNIAKLATWGSQSISQATVTNEPKATGNTHSRGQVNAYSSTPKIRVSAKRSNTGLTDTLSLDAYDTYPLDDDTDASALGQWGEGCDTINKGLESCDYNTLNIGVVVATGFTIDGTLTITGQTGLQSINDVVLTVDIGSGPVACTRGPGATSGNVTEQTFTCELDTNGEGTIVIEGYQLVDASTGLIDQDNVVCSGGNAADLNGTTGTVVSSGNIDESTEFVFSAADGNALAGDVTGEELDVKKPSGPSPGC